MPTYQISAPNGKIYEIEGPDGASQEDVIAQVTKQFPDSTTPLRRGAGTRTVDTATDAFFENSPLAALGRALGTYDPTLSDPEERAALGPEGETEARRQRVTEASRLNRERSAARDTADPVLREDQAWYNPETIGRALSYFGGEMIGGAPGDPSSIFGPGKTVVQQALAQTGIGAVVDAGLQGTEMAQGVRDEYSPLQTAVSAGAGGALTAAAGAAGKGFQKLFPDSVDEPAITPDQISSTTPQASSMPEAVQQDIAARIDAGQSLDEIAEAHPMWMDVGTNKSAVRWYVENRRGGGNEPVQFAPTRTDLDPSSVEGQLQQEAQNFQATREPTPEDLWTSEETLRAREADMEARLTQEADAWKNRDQELPEPTPETILARVQSVIDEVDSVIGSWKTDPDITVVSRADEIPDPVVRARIEADAATGAKGVTLDDGRVFIIADNLTDPTDVKAVLYHEALGHKGMSTVFQDRLDGLLTQIYDTTPDFRDKVDSWLADNSGSYLDAPNRVARAADEVLAEMSESGPMTATVINRIKNYIKMMARRAGLKDVEFSDREIRTILAMAHDAVIKGKPGGAAANGYRTGNRYMMVGENASKVDKDSLMLAKQAEGEGVDVSPSGETRLDFGWFKGPDGKWRYEISDQPAKTTPLFDRLADQSVPDTEASLTSVLDHPELFEKYPALQSVKVSRDAGLYGKDYDGGWSVQDGLIYINPDLTWQKATSTLLHEVQHAIQDMEGFASGGNPDNAISKAPDQVVLSGAKNYYRSLKSEAKQASDKAAVYQTVYNSPLRKQYKEAKSLKEMDAIRDRMLEDELGLEGGYSSLTAKEKVDWYGLEADVIFPENSFSRAAVNEVTREAKTAKMFEESFKKLMDSKDANGIRMAIKKDNLAKFEAYQHLFGEVEARDTEARIGMSDAQRQLTNPYTSEPNVNPDQYIFNGGDEGLSASTRDIVAQDRALREQTLKDNIEAERQTVDRLGIDPADVGLPPKYAPLTSIRYSNGKKFSTSPESMRTVNDLDDVLMVLGKEAEELSGGPRSIREIERAADDLGLTASKYLRGKSLEDQNISAQVMGAKQLLTNTVEELAQLGDKARNEGMTPTLRANIASKLATARAIYAKFDGDTAEVGRSLRVLKEVSESRRSGKALARFMDESQERIGALSDDALTEAISIITKTEGPEAGARAINKARKLHWEDYAGSVVYNSMLSSPVTWVKNFLGSPMNFITDMAVDMGASFASKALPKGADRITSAEIGARLLGPLDALRSYKTYQNIGNAFYTGRSRNPGFEGKVGNNGPVFKGPASALLEGPTRVMAGVDEVWSNLFFQSNFAGEAVREAVRSGKKGQALKDEITRLRSEPTPELVKRAQEATNRQLFRDSPSSVGQTLLDILTPRYEPEIEMRMVEDPTTGKMRSTSYLKKDADGQGKRAAKFAGRLAVPFIPTLDSIARTIIRNSGPVALVSKEIRKDLMTPGIKRQSALSRMAVASASLGYFGYLASEGLMTGMEADPWQEGQARSAVKPPMSIKIGGEWISYAGFDPIAGQMAAAATAVERSKRTGEVISAGNLGALVAGMGEALIHSSYAESLLNTLKMVEEGRELVQEGETSGAAVTNFAAGQAANVMNPAFVRWLNQEYLDPAARDTSGDGTLVDRALSRAMAGTPGLSEELPQKYDVFGRPMETLRQDRMVENDPTILEINRLEEIDNKIVLGPPDRTIYKNTAYQTKLTGEQYQLYQAYSGGWAVEDIAAAMASPEWPTLTDEERIDWVKEIRDQARKDARAQLFPPPEEEDQVEEYDDMTMEEGL